MPSRVRTARFLGFSLLILGCSVSTQQEEQIGQQDSAQINQQLPLVQDPLINQYVNQLGYSIAHLTSRGDLPWKFYVVNTDAVNAFALPGGIIYVNRGVLERATAMDELAGVLGHEIQHVVLRHSVKQMTQQQEAQVGVTLGCVLTGACQSSAAQEAINLGGTLVFAKMSRTDEKQADDGGFQNVMRAGISPEGMLSFFQKLLKEEQSSGGGSSSGAGAWFADHPGTEDRIADIRRMLSGVPQSQLNSLVRNTQAFNQMKGRLAQLPPAPPQKSGGQ